jgi:prepilin-type N-terminal cleavage/methylation domain-containing protein
MKQGGHKKVSVGRVGLAVERGFTIVETMIVLAVTGSLFVSAVVMISGRQNKTEFSTAINSLQQQLQQVVTQTSSGYYPSRGDFSCTASGSTLSFTNTSRSQGTNTGCIFLGNAIQVGLNSNSSQLGIVPLVGLQNSSGTPVQTIANAKPRAVYPAGGTESGFDATTTDVMQYGLAPAASNQSSVCGGGAGVTGGMCFVSSGVPYRTGIVAFVSGDNAGNIVATNSNGDLAGSQQFSLYSVKYNAGGNIGGTNESLTNASLAIGNNAVNSTNGLLVHADKVSICIASATTDQSGLFTIDSGLHVSLQIRSGTVCA